MGQDSTTSTSSSTLGPMLAGLIGATPTGSRFIGGYNAALNWADEERKRQRLEDYKTQYGMYPEQHEAALRIRALELADRTSELNKRKAEQEFAKEERAKTGIAQAFGGNSGKRYGMRQDEVTKMVPPPTFNDIIPSPQPQQMEEMHVPAQLPYEDDIQNAFTEAGGDTVVEPPSTLGPTPERNLYGDFRQVPSGKFSVPGIRYNDDGSINVYNPESGEAVNVPAPEPLQVKTLSERRRPPTLEEATAGIESPEGQELAVSTHHKLYGAWTPEAQRQQDMMAEINAIEAKNKSNEIDREEMYRQMYMAYVKYFPNSAPISLLPQYGQEDRDAVAEAVKIDADTMAAGLSEAHKNNPGIAASLKRLYGIHDYVKNNKVKNPEVWLRNAQSTVNSIQQMANRQDQMGLSREALANQVARTEEYKRYNDLRDNQFWEAFLSRRDENSLGGMLKISEDYHKSATSLRKQAADPSNPELLGPEGAKVREKLLEQAELQDAKGNQFFKVYQREHANYLAGERVRPEPNKDKGKNFDATLDKIFGVGPVKQPTKQPAGK